MISKETALANKVPVGAYVQTVIKDSPAEKSGIKTGDIITEIDGKKMDEAKDTSVVEAVNQKKIGDTLKIKYFRDKTETEVEVRLEKKQG